MNKQKSYHHPTTNPNYFSHTNYFFSVQLGHPKLSGYGLLSTQGVQNRSQNCWIVSQSEVMLQYMRDPGAPAVCRTKGVNYKHYPSPKDYIREDILMVLNQVHPPRCASSDPSQQGHLPGAWGCRHRRRQGFAAIFRSDASLPDWLEGGGGPLDSESESESESDTEPEAEPEPEE